MTRIVEASIASLDNAALEQLREAEGNEDAA